MSCCAAPRSALGASRWARWGLVLVMLSARPTAADAQGHQPLIGDRVRIEGPVLADGSLVVRRVSRRPWRVRVAIRGPIEAIALEPKSLTVLGFTVLPRPEPGKEAEWPGDLRVGDVVEIEGLRSSSMIRALEIRRVEPGGTRPSGYFEGDLQSIDEDGFTLLGRRAWLPAAAARLDGLAPGSQDVVTRVLRQDEDDLELRVLAGPAWLALGGRLDASLVREQNFALASEPGESTDRTTSSAQLEALVSLPAGIEVFGEVKARHRVLGRDERYVDGSLKVAEAFVSAREIGASPASVHVGRQRFRDTRGWFFDVDLDAVRVELAGRRWTVEAAVAENPFAPDHARDRRDQRHVIGSASVDVGRSTMTGRFIARDDQGVRGEKPLFLGASVHGRLGRRLDYWSDLALSRGRIGQVALRGWAADVGGAYRWRSRWNPALLLGYAIGSADRSPDDEVDGTFRPTALESNRYRLSRTKWLSYYGEVLDPDLSNLRVLTAAFSIESPGGFSVEAVYHHYAQVASSSRLARNDLRASTTGDSPFVGREFDTVLRFRRQPLDLALVAGVFFPGPGLEAALRPAVLIRPQVRVQF